MEKTALILGGTRGLGLSLAFEATNNRRKRAIITGRSILSNLVCPYNSEVIALDLTDPPSINRFFNGKTYPSFDYFFWVAGIFLRKPIIESSLEDLDKMIATHISGPIQFLRLFHNYQVQQRSPYHLVTVASTSSWRIRGNETLYCALKAAKAAFTRNFAVELVRDLPGSKVTLINPGGMKTGLFDGTGQDISKFMEPDVVAKIIWDEVDSQATPFKEVQIMRNDDGSPNISYGPRMPELPF